MDTNSPTEPIHIGWATQDVTPDRPVILRGQFHARISETVNDPLTVTALALESGGEQCVMVSADRVSIPEALLAGVRQKLESTAPDLTRTRCSSARPTRTRPPQRSTPTGKTKGRR